MAYHSKKGWYKLLNVEKFIKPIDGYMKSFNESKGQVEYKSSLELNAIRYCDYNKFIVKWSCEPFNIKYVKPIDGKVHRYFIDLYVQFETGHKFLIEVKQSSETKPPRKPRKQTAKSLRNYERACVTYSTNSAKWAAAEQFAKQQGMYFTFLTEKELK